MARRPNSGKKSNLSQFGLIDIPDINDIDNEPMDLSDDDIDLEAELAAISGGQAKRRPKKPPPLPAANLDAMIAESLKEIPSNDEASSDDDPELLAELQDLALDDDEEAPPPPPRASRPAPAPPGAPLSNDSSTISMLQDRITNYTVAEKNAKTNGEASRARRFNRGLKTLQDLLKRAKAGKPVNNEDIPPPVVVGKPAAATQPEDPPAADVRPPSPAEAAMEVPDEPLIDLGPPVVEPEPNVPEPNVPEAEAEEPRAPSPEVPEPRAPAPRAPAPRAPAPRAPSPEVPEPRAPAPRVPSPSAPVPSIPVPSESSASKQRANGAPGQDDLQIILDRKDEFRAAALDAKRRGNKTLALNLLKVTKQFDLVVEAYKKGEVMDLNELPTVAMFTEEGSKEEDTKQSSASAMPEVSSSQPIIAATVREGLLQRLSAFRELEAKAKEEGNMSKARRMHRIMKQYMDAIKLHEAGRQVALDDLPAPAGYGPLPTGKEVITTSSREPSPERDLTTEDDPLAFLMQEQRKFKEAALFFKRTNCIASAKMLVRNVKLFDCLIADVRAGKPIVMANVPTVPYTMQQLEAMYGEGTPEELTNCTRWIDNLVGGAGRPRRRSESGGAGPSRASGGRGGRGARGGITSILPMPTPPDDAIMADALGEDASLDTSGSDTDIIERLRTQLKLQRQLCQAHYNHNVKIGNIIEARKMEQMIEDITEYLHVGYIEYRSRRVLPRFHYEMRQFSTVQCNTYLNANDLELVIVRGIAYNVPNPKEVDTYVKFEFPFPQDAPIYDRTAIVKDTNSPEYNQTFNLAINRSRACLRVFKRHGIKFEVWSKGGWFRSDVLVGACTVKLAPLQEYVTLHDSFPLMDGRRPTGGSLEVKINVRTPLLQQHIKTTQHRWIVMDD